MKPLSLPLKIYLLFTISVITAADAFTQTPEFAPVGAKWWYTNKKPASEDYPPEVKEVIGDTIIDGKVCKIIKSNFYSGEYNFEYLFQDEKVIYNYIKQDSTFRVIYDFSKPLGQSYISYSGWGGTDSTLVFVLNYDTINLSGMNLIMQEVSINGPATWGNVNLEKIGNISYMTPFNSLVNIFPGPLRCYEDAEIGHYETGIVENCDDLILNISPIESVYEITVYPNPASNLIIISNTLLENLRIQILTMEGLLVSEIFSKKNEITFPIDYLPEGYYIVSILGESQLYNEIILKL